MKFDTDTHLYKVTYEVTTKTNPLAQRKRE